MKWKYYILAGMVVIGSWLRFANLGALPLWMDEAILWAEASGGRTAYESFVSVQLAQFLPKSEFWLRFPSAFFGMLSIFFVWWVVRKYNETAALLCASFLAFPNLFVWWSRMARPYALSGFLIILGWRWWPCLLVSIVNTPLAMIGMDWPRLKTDKAYWWKVLICLGLSFLLFKFRPDNGRGFFNLHFLWTARRMWYLPLVCAILHFGKYGYGWLVSFFSRLRIQWRVKDYIQAVAITNVIAVSVFFMFSSAEMVTIHKLGWWSGYVRFSNWRGVKPVDYATNNLVAWYYTGKEPKLWRIGSPGYEEFKKRVNAEEGVSVGLDYYACTNLCSSIVPEGVRKRDCRDLILGWVTVYEVKRIINPANSQLEAVWRPRARKEE